MVNLYLSGYGYSKRRCKAVIEWFICKYLPKHQITIEVLHRGLKRDSTWGWCDVSGKTYSPREFLIEIQSGLSEHDYITTLLHELYHVYQFVIGDLKLRSFKRYYKGVCVDEIDYQDQEHEKEAYRMEKELYKEFTIYLNT